VCVCIGHYMIIYIHNIFVAGEFRKNDVKTSRLIPEYLYWKRSSDDDGGSFFKFCSLPLV